MHITRSMPVCSCSPGIADSLQEAVSSSPSSSPAINTTHFNGLCGVNNPPYSCYNSTFGNCCAAQGYCGRTDVYCGTGCQAGYGNCGIGSSSPVAAPFSSSRTPTLRLSEAIPDRVAERAVLTSYTPSTNGACGPQPDGSTFSCAGSTFGTCCSQNSYCGNTDAYCGAGCNPLYGTCNSVSSSPSPSPSPSSVVISPDGSCGGTNGYTCVGSTFGNCCSSNGYCGSTTAYCGTGCNPLYGTCGTPSSVSPSTSASASPSASARPVRPCCFVCSCLLRLIALLRTLLVISYKVLSTTAFHLDVPA